jgi:hypothetical protein
MDGVVRVRGRQAMIAFIDLLGFSHKARTARSQGDLNTLYDALSTIRNEFDFKPSDRSTKEAQKVASKNVMMFSDCIIVALPIRSRFTQAHGNFDLFADELTILALSQGNCAIKGQFIRGGIDLGLWYYKNNYLISPSLATAYELEGQAVQPILAVSDRLYCHLRDHPDRSNYAPDIDPMNYMFRIFNSESGRSIRYLDYIGISLDAVEEGASMKRRAEKFRRVCGWLSNHSNSIHNAYENAPSGRPKAKLQWLAEYHNDVVRSRAKGTKKLMVTL